MFSFASRYHYTALQAAVGAKVILTRNVDINTGATNGCTWHIVAFNYVASQIRSVVVIIDATGQAPKVCQTTTEIRWHNGQQDCKKASPCN